MVKTKGIAATVSNYQGAIGRVPGAYKAGVSGATDWQANALKGEDLWKQKIAEAAANNARSRGISKVSDGEWKTAASNKGASRIAGGMTESLPKFQRNMSEVLSVIEGTQIADRVADGEANVDGRVKPIVRNLQNWKKTK